MKRRLVTTNDVSRHWMRQRLPLQSLYVPQEERLLVRKEEDLPLFKRESTHLFLLSYFAFFTAIYTFIA